MGLGYNLASWLKLGIERLLDRGGRMGSDTCFCTSPELKYFLSRTRSLVSPAEEFAVVGGIGAGTIGIRTDRQGTGVALAGGAILVKSCRLWDRSIRIALASSSG
jgi:hypothetical protein